MKSFFFLIAASLMLGSLSARAYSQVDAEYLQYQKEVQAYEAQQALGEGDMIFNNAFGKVTFPHLKHQGAFKCEACHPPFVQKYDDSISIKDLAHQVCKDCHKASNVPTTCTFCHKK